MSVNNDFAIIGAAAKIAHTSGMDEYWDCIIHNYDALKGFPFDRQCDTDEYLRLSGYEKHKSDYSYIPGAYIDDIAGFDYSFFRIPFQEARLMDPNQRLMLQTAYQAVENAGYGGQSLNQKQVGVYVGYNAGMQLYQQAVNMLHSELKEIAFAGNESSVIAGRIANFLNITGPAVMLDCACSSSLMALHTAISAIKNGDCESALVCAVSLKMLLLDGIEKLGTVADDFKTRTFDQFADGTGPGEGVISIYIKPYQKAIDDRDPIHAIIKGSAVNHNGHTMGILAPSVSSQTDVILRAWERAGVNPEDIGFIEAHGTATRLGDPVEILALKKAFAKYTQQKQFCAISSVKTNFGHLKSAAGLAGLLKCVMAVKEKVIPPTNNFQYPNHQISFHLSPVYINDVPREWEPSKNGRICAVSSFGINGTNCHVVIADHTIKNNYSNLYQGMYLFVLSAVSQRSLRRLIYHYYKYFETNEPDIGDLCFTLQVGRGHYQHRLAICIENIQQLKDKLSFLVEHGLHDQLPDSILYKFNKLKRQKKEKTILFFDLKQAKEIAYAYCEGQEIQWLALYENLKMNRIHLPEYAFDNKRCWLSDNAGFDTYDLYENSYIEDKEFIGYLTNGEVKDIIIIACTDDRNRDQDIIQNYSVNFNAKTVTMSDQFDTSNKMSDENNLRILGEYIDDTPPSSPKILMFMNLGKNEKRIEQLYIVLQYIAQHNRINKIEKFFYISSQVVDMNKKVNIEYAYPYGLLKAAVWEMPQINFRLIDIESWANIDCIWNEIHQKTLNSNIYDNRSFAVVYHDEKRFYEVLHKKFILKSGAGSIQFSENGVYIITGGLGGIGMLIAEFLLERGAVNIALFTRTDQKQITEKYADQLQKINRWKEDGANILLIKTDVTVKDEVHDAVVYLRQTFSNIIGIFHCAVESQGGTIADTSYKDYMRKMNAKVEGANYLDEFTKEDSIEFFVLFSSAITTIGGYGSAAYITSNQYLLGLAEKMRIQGRNVTVIQWPAWLNTGIADRNIILPERELFFPLLPHEAIWVLENILISRVNSSIAGRINRNSLVFTLSEQLPFMIEKTNSVRQDDLDTITKKNINLTGRDDGHYSFEENSIACIWADFLGADQIDIDSNFFELGGDSISAIRITNQIKAEWQGIFEVRDFLSNPTVRKQAVLLRNMQCENKQAEAASILNNELEENIYPASSAQRRMFIHNYMNPESMVYNLPEVIEINGIVQVTRLLDVLYTILNTHDIFSTELRLQDNDVFQVLHNREFNVQVKDISERQLDDEINSFIRPFQLDKLENFRCTILRLSPDRHVLLYDIHHALFDGVSRSIFFRSLVQGYSGGEIIKPKAQYKDYAIYQDRAKQFSKTLLSQKDYWVKKIKKSLSSIDLIPNIIQFNENKGNRLIFYMESELLDKVNVFVQQTASTFFIFLLAVYSMIRYKVTRRQISVVATPVEGRPDKKFESTMGMFVNTLVLINKVDEKLCFMDYYKQIYENTISDLSNQDYQFDDLISDLKLSRNYGQFPLFDTMLVLQDKTFSTNFTGNGIQIKSREIKVNQIKFPSILEVIRLDDRVEFHFDYCQTIIKDETAKEICKWIIELSDAIIRDPNICLNALLKSCKKDKPMIGIDNFEF